MSQNLVKLKLSDTQLAAVDSALTELETQLDGLIALSLPVKKSLRRMGQKSEAFCRHALRVMEQNPQIVPSSVLLADALEGLNTLEQLRPRIIRLARLSERASDTNVGLGSDVMMVALQGYSLLKLAGQAQGLDGLRQELGTRFAKASRKAPQPADAPQLEAKAA